MVNQKQLDGDCQGSVYRIYPGNNYYSTLNARPSYPASFPISSWISHQNRNNTPFASISGKGYVFQDRFKSTLIENVLTPRPRFPRRIRHAAIPPLKLRRPLIP